MNFNQILTQLHHAELQNRLLDHNFMTAHAYQSKYKNSQPTNQPLSFSHQSGLNSKNNNPFKKAKHRYFEDIQKDQIEDANIFGYSTFDYLSFFKKNSTQSHHPSNALITKQMKKLESQAKQKLSKAQNDDPLQQSTHQLTTSFTRPKTAIVSRGTPTKRKVHHKLSLSQTQKSTSNDNPHPGCMKQQYFTEEIFDFNPNEKNQQSIENVRFGSKTATLYKQIRPGTRNQGKQKKSQYYFENQSEKHPKRHLILQQTIKKFNPHEEKEKKLTKRRRKNLDKDLIESEKQNFTKGISGHFDNLGKGGQVIGSHVAGMTKTGGLQSVVYGRQVNNRRVNEQLAHYTESIRQKTVNPRRQSPNRSKAVIINAHNNPTERYEAANRAQSFRKNPTVQKQYITQTTYTQPQFLKQLKLSSSINIYQAINPFLLERGQLPDLQFKYDPNYTPLHHSDFQRLLIRTINNHWKGVSDFKSKSLQHFNPKSLSKLHKQKSKLYTVWIVDCMTLEWVKFQNAQLKDQALLFNGNALNLLLVAQKIMLNSLPSHFVHLMITRSTSIPSQTSPHERQILVYQTFIHNSDIKYFEGREVQIQYFKYFLKRFITFDPNISKKDEILSSISLVFQSEVRTPRQFEEFCQEMKIKDNMHILALRNLDAKQENLTFRSVEISLSKLLVDASETLMMVKKELIQEYDWRGVSLANDAKQYRGYHLEHFYI